MHDGFLSLSLRKGVSFYAFRRPDGKDTVFGAARSWDRGMREGGFVIAPFDLESGEIRTVIPSLSYEEIASLPDCASAQESPECPFPESSTTRCDHASAVRAVSGYHRKHGGKTVISRVIVSEDCIIDVDSLFDALCRLYADAAVFCFFTPESGLWIGASPELLLSQSGGRLNTMALAGTRVCGTNGAWDDKNLEEQSLVTDFIMDAMDGLNPEKGNLFTRQAGPVEHLCTRIVAEAVNESDVEKLLRRLSPTPALCGSVRKESLRLIASCERHSRGYYGGFFGISREDGFELYVNLRSMRLEGRKAAVFVGGGITGMSVPEDEWTETCRKSQAVLRAISEIQPWILSKFDN